MRKPGFLNKLCNEGKLKLVEPSREISDAYFQKSAKSLVSAKALLKIGNLEDSVALAYYSMYHSVVALLFRIGVKCENHTAAIILLNKVFRIDSRRISEAKAERVDKQYYVDFAITEEETKEAIVSAEDFTAEMKDFTEKINSEKIKNYRDIAGKLFKSSLP